MQGIAQSPTNCSNAVSKSSFSKKRALLGTPLSRPTHLIKRLHQLNISSMKNLFFDMPWENPMVDMLETAQQQVVEIPDPSRDKILLQSNPLLAQYLLFIHHQATAKAAANGERRREHRSQKS